MLQSVKAISILVWMTAFAVSHLLLHVQENKSEQTEGRGAAGPEVGNVPTPQHVVNERLLPQLQKMEPGSRIVSHDFGILGVEPDIEVRCFRRLHGMRDTSV